MNNIEILEELKARLKLYKKSTDVQFTFTKSDIQAIENLIQENKELKEVLEKVSKDLDNIAYDQIPIEMQRAFGKEYDLGYRQGWYNAEEDWKLKVKEYYKKVKEKIKKTEEDRRYGRYKEYGGKIKLDKYLARLYGINEICEIMLEEGE